LLDPDLDLEADLGVDTVKQAEVFAAVREKYQLERDDNLRLRDFPTLRHVAGWVRTKTGLARASLLRPLLRPPPRLRPRCSAPVAAAPAAALAPSPVAATRSSRRLPGSSRR
jgi:hypothetical protein